jgi:hypothetical protein
MAEELKIEETMTEEITTGNTPVAGVDIYLPDRRRKYMAVLQGITPRGKLKKENMDMAKGKEGKANMETIK